MFPGPILLIAQATAANAAPLPAPSAKPDVELRASVEIREMTILQEVPIRVTLTPEANSEIEVVRSAPAGARTYRNLTIDARIAAVLSQDGDGTLIVSQDSSTGEQPQ